MSESSDAAENREPTPGPPRRWLRWTILWGTSAVVGVAGALLTWWLLTPHMWFWKVEQDLDSPDAAARGAAVAQVVAQQDPRMQALVEAKLAPWLDDPSDRRFRTAFNVLNAWGALPPPADRPQVYLRNIRLQYAATSGQDRADVVEGLESLRAADLPEAAALLKQAIADADPLVRAQAAWTAMRAAGRLAPDVLLAGLASDDAVVAELSARGLLWAEGVDEQAIRTRCAEALAGRMAAGPAAVRVAACYTWATRFAADAPDAPAELVGLTRDADPQVAATAVGLLDFCPSGAASARVAEILASDAQSLLTTRAAMAAGRMKLDSQADRLVHWVYHGDDADLRQAAAASLGELSFPKKAETLTAMLANAVLEEGTTLDMAVLAAMRKAVASDAQGRPPEAWRKLVEEVCSKLPTDEPASLPATEAASTQAIILAGQPMVANEAAVLLADWDPDAARKFLWVQMDSPIIEIRERAATALGRILDPTFSAMLQADLVSFSQARRSAAALALGVAKDAAGLDRIHSLLGRVGQHPAVVFGFRAALWIGGRGEIRDVPGLAEAGNVPADSVMRAALLAHSPEGLHLLLAAERDPRNVSAPEQLDEFLQATRLFELLDGVVPGWGGPALCYRPQADAAWRVAQCRRLEQWYLVYGDRLGKPGGRPGAE